MQKASVREVANPMQAMCPARVSMSMEQGVRALPNLASSSPRKLTVSPNVGRVFVCRDGAASCELSLQATTRRMSWTVIARTLQSRLMNLGWYVGIAVASWLPHLFLSCEPLHFFTEAFPVAANIASAPIHSTTFGLTCWINCAVVSRSFANSEETHDS